MQRQAVPLLRARAPFVGTGMEHITARDSGAVVTARRAGVVDLVDSQRIVVRAEGEPSDEDPSSEMGADIYTLTKFRRSNQNTCINQKPIVEVGTRVERGQVLADGPCTELGELALGRNVLVAFMPWRGYNFEDAILVSERLVKEDYYTSIHIEEFEIESRDTKLGPEGDHAGHPERLRGLPERPRREWHHPDRRLRQAERHPRRQGDAEGETQLTPEEKLLRAIFGEKAGDVRDASLVCPPGHRGIVVGVRIFSRKGTEKDERAKAIESAELEMMETNLHDEVRILHDEVKKRLLPMIEGKSLSADLRAIESGDTLLAKGTTSPSRRSRISLRRPAAGQAGRAQRAGEGRGPGDPESDRPAGGHDPPALRGEEGEGPPGRRVAAGRDQDGQGLRRHEAQAVGRRQDGRPPWQQGGHRADPAGGGYAALPDGTPVEIVLNPLGVPSRMNVGQILETHLGWGRARARPLLRVAGLRRRPRERDQGPASRGGASRATGKTPLFDGMTGEVFEQKVTVGYIYMLKLSHLVDDKIHARSIGRTR